MNKEDAWTTDTNAKIILQKLGISELDKNQYFIRWSENELVWRKC